MQYSLYISAFKCCYKGSATPCKFTIENSYLLNHS